MRSVMGLAVFARFRMPMVSGHSAAKLEVSGPSQPPSVTVKVLTGVIPTSLVVFHHNNYGELDVRLHSAPKVLGSTP